MPVRDVVVLSAARTPIGRYGGLFKDVHPAELGAVAARAAMARAGIGAGDVDEVVIGHGRQAGSGRIPAGRSAIAPACPTPLRRAHDQQGVCNRVTGETE